MQSDFISMFARQIFVERDTGAEIHLSMPEFESILSRAMDDERLVREGNPMSAVEQLRRYVEQHERLHLIKVKRP